MSERISYAGTHKARAKEWALGKSNGKEQIGIMFEFTAPPLEGRSITAYLYFTDATVDRTLESLRHCGWDADSIADLDSLGNNEVELVIEDEEYDGKVRSKVKWVNRVSRLMLKDQMDASSVAAFAARLRGKAVASKQKYGAQPAATAPKRSTAAAEPAFDEMDPGPTDDDF